ncbi:hypothetical protein Tco_1210954 [Tanacetum coccineum]
MMYYQITKEDGSSKNYKIFSETLDDFDRQDVMDLHRLVQERYDTTSPEGYDLLLWGDLKILFEPNEEEEIWKNQQDYNLISWRLFDSCGIHMLLMHTGIAIHMMIEKKYPLTQEMLSRMLSRRLEVDHESEMAFELLSNYGVTCKDKAKRRNSRTKTKTFEENCYLLLYAVSSKEDAAYQHQLITRIRVIINSRSSVSLFTYTPYAQLVIS